MVRWVWQAACCKQVPPHGQVARGCRKPSVGRSEVHKCASDCWIKAGQSAPRRVLRLGGSARSMRGSLSTAPCALPPCIHFLAPFSQTLHRCRRTTPCEEWPLSRPAHSTASRQGGSRRHQQPPAKPSVHPAPRAPLAALMPRLFTATLWGWWRRDCCTAAACDGTPWPTWRGTTPRTMPGWRWMAG